MLASTTRFLGLSVLCSAALILGCADQGGNDDDTVGDGIGPGDGVDGGGTGGTGGDGVDDDGDGDGPIFDVGADDGTGDNGGGESGEGDGCKLVDLLFIIDNSGSMADEQENLINSVPGFIDAIQTELAETMGYNIGVITTDDYDQNENGCRELGALVTRTSQGTCTPFAAGNRYMTEADDLDDTFGCAAAVGTNGDGDEKPMEAMVRALSGQVGQCNQGFLRDDALLVLVIITDEEDDMESMTCNTPPGDGSQGDPSSWYQAVVDAKGGRPDNVVVLGLVGPDGNQQCPALDKCAGGIIGAEVGTRLLEFTRMFNNSNVGQVCAPDYGPFFQSAISIIDSACDDFEPPV